MSYPQARFLAAHWQGEQHLGQTEAHLVHSTLRSIQNTLNLYLSYHSGPQWIKMLSVLITYYCYVSLVYYIPEIC